MKRQICCFLMVLLLIGLTACGKVPGGNVTEPGNSAMTTEPVELVDVEVLTETIYYDTDGHVEARWEFFYDEMGRETREVHTDSEGNVIEEYTIRWSDDKRYSLQGFWYSQNNDNLKMYLEVRQDTEGGMYRVIVRYSGEQITQVEVSARDPYGNWAVSDDLDIGRYLAGDWGTSGWHYSTDQEGNLLSWIDVMTLDGLVQAECKCRPNGDLLHLIRKTDGVVTSTEEISYDEKGRPIRAANEFQIREWSYNDATNTGDCTSYSSDILWGEYEGFRKDWFEEYVYDSNGNVVTAYGQWYDTLSQTVRSTYTAVYEYDENNVCRSQRTIDADSGEVTVYTYDAHGNRILRETYDADGTLKEVSRTDYIYTTIQVTAEAAEKYHSE